MLVQWNDTAHDYDSRPAFVQIAEQVASTPDAIAVVDATERLTYADLQSRANQLAHELVATGVEPGSLVAHPHGPPDPAARLDARRVPDRRGLRTDRPDVPARPAGVHARRHPGAGADHAGEVPRHGRLRSLRRALRRPRLAADRRALRRARSASRSTPTIARTSSTRRARPDGRRASRSTHRGVSNLLAYMRNWPGTTPSDVIVSVATHAFDLPVPDFYLHAHGRRPARAVPPRRDAGRRRARRLDGAYRRDARSRRPPRPCSCWSTPAGRAARR